MLNWKRQPITTGEHMTQTTPLNVVKAGQRAWAQGNRRSLDSHGYCDRADNNLFESLSDTGRGDFGWGAKVTCG